MLGGGPLGKNIWYLHTHYSESSESLEGDHGRDRVRQCHLLTSFKKILEDDRVRDRV